MSSVGYAIVTGGGSGIGRAFCHALANRGWTVAVADCRDELAESVADEVASLGGRAKAETLDVADLDTWIALRTRLQAEWPQLDLLVNNAGTLITGTLDDCSPEDLRHIVDVNLLGAMHGCHAMLPWLRKAPSKAVPCGVINIASIFAAVAPPGFAAYNATKAGVLALTETLRGELKPFGLQATAVLPGVTPTSLFERARYANANHQKLCQQFVETSRITPAQVAAEALHGAARRRLYVVVGGRSKLYWRLKRFAPQWLIGKVGRRAVDEFGVLDRGPERSSVDSRPLPVTS